MINYYYCQLVILFFTVYYVKVDSIQQDSQRNCPNPETNDCSNIKPCEGNQFRCTNGNCIEMSLLCDNKDDCLDNSDESQYCKERECNPYQFKCVSGKCLPKHFVCNGVNECLDGSDESIDTQNSQQLQPPKVKIEAESYILYGNTTYQYMPYEDSFRVKYICEANYPIEWIFNFENVVGSAEIERGNVLESSLVFNVSSANSSLINYRNEISIYFYTIYAEDVFYCRAISQPCTQQMVVSSHYDESDPVYFKISDKISNKIVSIFSTTFGDTQSECDAIWYYEKNDDFGSWRCEHSSGRPGLISIIKCENANICNNYFRNNRQPKHCVKTFEEGVTCPDCDKLNDNSRHGRIVECFHEDGNLTSYSLQIFNGLPLGVDLTSNIYFDLSDIPLEELLNMDEFQEDIFLTQNITIICRASAYYFQSIIQIALEFENESVNYLLPDEEFMGYRSNEHEYFASFEIQVTSDSLKRIYCVGSSLNTLEKTNISISIFIQVPIGPMLISYRRNGTTDELEIEITNQFKNETIEWENGEIEKSIMCNVSGKPTPTITWSKDGHGIPATVEMSNRFEYWSYSQIKFSMINDTMAGLYKCEATNIASIHSKNFKITVKETVTTTSIIGGILASSVLLAVLSIACLMLCKKRKNKKEKQFEQTTAPTIGL